jgi:DNA-directed RNA polymerase subunit RPC12/RpoP
MKILQDVLTTFAAHATKYDFTSAVYHGSLKPITGIVCPVHGVFQQYAGQLQKLTGAGCPECGKAAKAAKAVDSRCTAGELYSRLKAALPGLEFPELLDNPGGKPGTARAILVRCDKHGDFHAKYSNLLKGKGCPTCAEATRGRYTQKYDIAPQAKVAEMRKAQRGATIVEQLREVHNGYYDYSEFVYNGMRAKSIIICPQHGVFLQAPMKHLAGSRCPKCSSKRLAGV